MSSFKTKINICNLEGKKCKEVELVVDTGARYSVISEDTLKELNIKKTGTQPFTLLDNRKIDRDIGNALFRFNGKERASPVIFGEKKDLNVLGAFTIESLDLRVNPVNERLEEEKLLML